MAFVKGSKGADKGKWLWLPKSVLEKHKLIDAESEQALEAKLHRNEAGRFRKHTAEERKASVVRRKEQA